MPRNNKPRPDHIFFVIDNTTNEVTMYGTKHLPITETQGARLKWWVTNSSLEQLGKAPVMGWSYKYDTQRDELQHRLGSGFTVLRQHEALKAIEQHQSDTQKIYVVTEHHNPEALEESVTLYAGSNLETAQRIYEAKKRSAFSITLHTFAGALKLL